jgi:hypothetical protein
MARALEAAVLPQVETRQLPAASRRCTSTNLPAAYFGVPPAQVVEVGVEVEI